jgi:hypothetical protein
MLFLAIIILITSLAIAGVAAYFSIIGLSLLFVGSGLAVIVMGTALEVGKLITVSVLHQLWEKLGLGLKIYLFIASFLLMVITSLGIYGFLTNGYNATNIKVKSLEQNKIENVQRLDILKKENSELLNYKFEEFKLPIVLSNTQENYNDQQLKLISQKEARIVELRNSISADRKKSIDEQNNAKQILDGEINKELQQITLFNNRLQILDKEVQTWLDQGTGGLFKQNGLEKARQVKESQQKERDEIDRQIKEVQINIDLLRKNYSNAIALINKSLDEQIKVTEKNIEKIENEIATILLQINENKKKIDSDQTKTFDIKEQFDKNNQKIVEENKNKITKNNVEIDLLIAKNKELDLQIIKTDVGTFKFVAKSLNLELDKTVNWFVLLIIIVFDPLAVALLLCFNHIIKNKPVKSVQDPLPVITTITEQQKIKKTEIEDQIKSQSIPTVYQQLDSTVSEPLSNVDGYPYTHLEQNLKKAYKKYPQEPSVIS